MQTFLCLVYRKSSPSSYKQTNRLEVKLPIILLACKMGKHGGHGIGFLEVYWLHLKYWTAESPPFSLGHLCVGKQSCHSRILATNARLPPMPNAQKICRALRDMADNWLTKLLVPNKNKTRLTSSGNSGQLKQTNISTGWEKAYSHQSWIICTVCLGQNNNWQYTPCSKNMRLPTFPRHRFVFTKKNGITDTV